MTSEILQTTHAYVLQPNEGQRLDTLRIRLLATGALTGGAVSGIECVRCSVQFDIIMASPGLNVGVAIRPEKCSRISAMTAGS